MNILDKRARDTTLECILIVVIPVFPSWLALWEVMETVSVKLV